MGTHSETLSYFVDVKANVGSIKSLTSQIQSSLNGLSLPKGIATELDKELTKLNKQIANYQAAMSTTPSGPSNKKEMTSFNNSWAQIDTTIARINGLMQELGNMPGLEIVSKEAIKNMNDLTKASENYQKAMAKVRETKDYQDKVKEIKSQKDSMKALEKARSGFMADLAKNQGKREAAQSLLKNFGISESDLKQVDTKIGEIEARKKELEKALSFQSEKSKTNALDKLGITEAQANQELGPLKEKLRLLNEYQAALNSETGDQTRISVNTEKLEEAQAKLQALKSELSAIETKGSTQAFGELAKQVQQLTGINPSNLDHVKEILANFETQSLERGAQAVKDIEGNLHSLSSTAEGTRGKVEGINSAFNGMMSREQDLANFTHRLGSFFSLTGITQSVRRVVRDVTDAIKELDSVMTETAVVTDFTISDMWEKLPQYTKQASKLGTSVASLYEATTLYYQQGLGDQAAMDVGVETMKMARIAGMEAEEATTAMTAALRGFNMEINEMSAARINDVYSELAAISASDTNQIATAMSKTASIASSANMEFETTAALLAQIIETTQEAPETAGTAMKTIIARFTEVKQLFSKGMLTGEDEEGEAIEINKIDKALQSVGISLKDFLLGKQGIDDIFLELASKWDTLDLATQRYIATTAAGSRQQSRFIAMMSNYDRTMELVTAANNSSGASQEQFNKTLDSLEAKMAKLKNAWNEFVMDIVNSDLVKGGIDILTGLLDTINKITNAFGKVGSPLAKIGLILGGFRLGRGLFMKSAPGQKMTQTGWLRGMGPGVISGFRNDKAAMATNLGMYPQGTQYSFRQMGLFGPSLKSIQAEYGRQIEVNQAEQKDLAAQLDGLKSKNAKINLDNLKETANKRQVAALAATERKNKAAAAVAPYGNRKYDDLTEEEQKALGKSAATLKSMQRQARNTEKAETSAKNEASKAQNTYNKALEESKDNAKKITKAEEDLAKKREEGKALAEEQTKMSALKKQQGYAIGSAVGTGLMLTGMGLGLASSVASKNGNEELAEGLSVASTVATATGVAFQSLTSIAMSLGASLGSVIVVAAGVIAALALIAVIANSIYARSAQGQIDIQGKTVDKAKESAEQAEARASSIKEELAAGKEREKNIDSLIRGTSEWKKAVEENNKAITDFVQNNSEFAGLVSNKDGVLFIDENKTVTARDVHGNYTQQTASDLLKVAEVAAKSAENTAIREQLQLDEMKFEKYRNDLLTNYGRKSGSDDGSTQKFEGFIYTDKKVDGERVLSDIEKEYNDQLLEAISRGAVTSIEEATEWVKKLGDESGKNFDFKLTEESFDDLRTLSSAYVAKELSEQEGLRKVGSNIKDIAEIYGVAADDLGEEFVGLVNNKTQESIKKNYMKTLSKNNDAGYKEYAKLMGYDKVKNVRAINGTAIFKKDGKRIKRTKEEVAEFLAEQDANTDTAFRLGAIDNTITAANKDLFTNLVSQDGQEIGTKDLSALSAFLENADGLINMKDLIKEDEFGNTIGTESGDQLAKMMTGGKFTTLASWADAIGIEVGEFAELLTKNVEAAADRITDERKTLATKMAKYSTGDYSRAGEGYEVMAQTLAGYEARFGDAGREMMTEVMNSLEASGDENLISSGWTKFMSMSLEMTKEEAQGLADTISNINWANPIEATKQINQQLKIGSGSSREFAQHIKDSNTSFFGLGSQMRYLLEGSGELEGMSESLDEIIKQNGEISASDIYDLAEEYKSLGDIMENTGASAGALAEVLERVQMDDLGVHQVTDAVVAAIDQIDGLASMIAGLEKDFSKFDPGIDENFASEFIAQASEVFKTNLDKKAFGNSQLDAYMDYLVGEDWDEGLDKEARTAALKTAGKFFEKNSQNMSAAWADMAKLLETGKADGLLGDRYTGEDLGFKITRDASTGEITMSGYDHLTWDEMAKNMSETFGVTERMAKALLTDFANYSGDLALLEKQRESSVEDVSAEALAKGAEIGGQKTLDQSEIDAIAKLTGLEAKDISKQIEAQGGVVTNFYDEYGQVKTGKDAWEEYTGVTGQNVDDFIGPGFIDSQTQSLIDIRDNGKFSQIESLQSLLTAYGQTQFADRIKAANISESQFEGYRYAQQHPNEKQNILKELGLNQQQLSVLDEIFSLEGKEVFDMAALEDELAKSGLSEAVQEQIKAGALSAFTDNLDDLGRATEEYEVQARMSDGSIQNIKVAAGQTFEEAYNQADLKLQNDSLAKSLATAIVNAQSGLDAITPTIDTKGIQTQLDNQTYTISVNGVVSVSGGDTNSGGGTTGGATSVGQKPRIGPSYASGLSSAKRTHAALTGELGPELIWRRSQNQFYLAGMNGPEMTTVNPADTVFTAEETKQILNQPDGPKMPGFAKGLKGPSYASAYSGVTSGGKSTSNKNNEWENPFDKLYNLLRKIDEELRERERIERRYEKLLEDIGVSADKIINISREELAQLEKERQYQEQLISGRKDQIAAYQKENSQLLQYASVTQNERGEDILRIDWEAIDAITDKEKGSEVETYVNQLEEWFDSLTEAEDALWEIEDLVAEINERGKDEYFDLEEVIKDAVEKTYQDQIDELEKINDSINDTNAELLEGIQKTISKQRQDRENEKTEEDLADKQRRLSYLQMDTSGANAVEILKLQKEIEEGQENYTDTLIDQKISELQEQNDEAAKQREKQIDLLQAQLDHYLESGRIWRQVNELMAVGVDAVNGLIPGSELEQLLQNEAGFKGMSAIGKMEWMNETNNMIAQALAYLELGRQLEDIGVKAGTKIEFVTADGQKLTGTVDKDGVVTTADGKKYDNVYQTYDGTFRAGENITPVKAKEVEKNPKSGSGSGTGTETGSGQNKGGYYIYTSVYNGTHYTSTISPGDAYKKAQAAKAADADKVYNGVYKSDYDKTKAALAVQSRPIVSSKSWHSYKTGGLADYTGPAWLDGTKSRPELVLNARDTENFIQLKDILSSILSGSLGNSTSTENNGDITYDIDINVENISSDYDVDKVASRVKTLITEDARYRNNNAVSLKR